MRRLKEGCKEGNGIGITCAVRKKIIKLINFMKAFAADRKKIRNLKSVFCLSVKQLFFEIEFQ